MIARWVGLGVVVVLGLFVVQLRVQCAAVQ